jgi:molybdopterin-containing oxidoreductase family iron-sulfur binding subunit
VSYHGRNKAWLNIQRYATRSAEDVKVDLLPMLCQQCDNAPCETVCPVEATYHTNDGLNAQVYNRCVGTRYCANNCPYKARAFNWWDPKYPAPLDMQLNPDVNVRMRGVMEKCTFCVQRIRLAESDAKTAHRPLADGEFTTACAQTCPSQAIVFGDLQDPNSRVAHFSKDPRGYHVLEELNTRPAVTYLARVRKEAT